MVKGKTTSQTIEKIMVVASKCYSYFKSFKLYSIKGIIHCLLKGNDKNEKTTTHSCARGSFRTIVQQLMRAHKQKSILTKSRTCIRSSNIKPIISCSNIVI